MRRCFVVAALIVAWSFVSVACAEAQQGTSPASSVNRQSLDDACWTGPMLAPSAATLPRGHFLVEPYLYDVIAAHSNSIGSLTYVNYGLADRVTVGFIPTAGFNKVSSGPSSSVVGLGDLTLQAQVPAHKFHAGSPLSLALWYGRPRSSPTSSNIRYELATRST
jgi:hypothetical protein